MHTKALTGTVYTVVLAICLPTSGAATTPTATSTCLVPDRVLPLSEPPMRNAEVRHPGELRRNARLGTQGTQGEGDKK